MLEIFAVIFLTLNFKLALCKDFEEICRVPDYDWNSAACQHPVRCVVL